MRLFGQPRNDRAPTAPPTPVPARQPEPTPAVVAPAVAAVAQEPALLVMPTLPQRKTPRLVGAQARKAGAKAVDLLIMSGVERGFAAGLVDWLLQEACGKIVKQPPIVPTEEDSDEDVLWRTFRHLHRSTTGVEPHVLQPDMVAAKRLLKKFGLDVVLRQLQALAAIEDQFVRQQGFSFLVLQRHWSRLATRGRTAQRLARRDAPAHCRHQPPCQTATEHSDRNRLDRSASPLPVPMSRTRTT